MATEPQRILIRKGSMNRGKLPGQVLDLKQFLLRRQVINLYREVFRVIREHESLDQQKQLTEWAKHEFKSKKELRDVDAIKMHLSKGRLALKEVASAIRMAK